MVLIFWLGVGLLIAAALVFAACGFSCFYHIGDDTGTSGGFDGIEVYCTPIAALTYILGGVFCMVGIHTWNLVVSIICNIISVFVHLFICFKCTGCGSPSEDASESLKRKASTAFIRVIPEILGIGLSFAAAIVAMQTLSE